MSTTVVSKPTHGARSTIERTRDAGRRSFLTGDTQALQRLVDLAGEGIDLPGISESIVKTLSERPVQLQLDLESIRDQLSRIEEAITVEVRLRFPEERFGDALVPDDVGRIQEELNKASEQELQTQTAKNKALALEERTRERLLKAQQLLTAEAQRQRELAEAPFARADVRRTAPGNVQRIEALQTVIDQLLRGGATDNLLDVFQRLNKDVRDGGIALQSTQDIFATVSSDISSQLQQSVDPAERGRDNRGEFREF